MAEQWFNFEEHNISMRVSTEGQPFKIEFFKYEAKEEKDYENLENGDRAASSLTPGEKSFYSNPYWVRKVKKNLEESPKIDISEEDVSDIVETFCMHSEDTLPALIRTDSATSEGAELPYEDEEIDEEWAERKAEKWLESPDLLSKLDRVIHHHLVGETKNALIVYLTTVSAKTSEPASLRPTGESSIGKSFLVTRVAKLVPDEMKILRKGFSEMAVWNKAESIEGSDRRVWNLNNKVMVILEESTAEEFLEQFRPVLSHDEKKITYEVTDTESQSRETLKIDIYGWPAYIGMRVGSKMDEQENTRAMRLTPDSGQEKYSKAVWWDSKKSETPWLDHMRKAETEVAKKVMEKLKEYKVLMPFREEIQKYFPTERRRHMRDWNQFSSLVEAMTILHQRQRPLVEVNGEKYLIAHPDDVKSVVKITKDALSETLHGLDTGIKKFWNGIKNAGTIEGYKELRKVYKNCFGEESSNSTIREKYINPLQDKGLIEVKEGSGSRPNRYKAGGSLSSLAPRLEKMGDKAYDFDIEKSTFWYMTEADTSPMENPKVVENNGNGGELREVDGIEDLKEFWSSVMEECPSIVEENEKLLNTTYVDDYGISKKEDEEKEEIETLDEGDEETDIVDEGEDLEEIQIEETSMSQKELVKELYNLYEDFQGLNGTLDYPESDEFIEYAKEHMDETKSRIRESTKLLSRKQNEVVFSGGIDDA